MKKILFLILLFSQTALAQTRYFGIDPTSRTLVNNFTFSEQFDNANWLKIRATTTGNASIAPDGTTTAEKIVEDTTAANTHEIRQAFTTVAGVYRFSVYAKAAEDSFVWIYSHVQNQGRFFNLTTGATANVVNNAPISSTIENVGSGWYRCTITVNLTAVANTFYIGVAKVNGTINFTGDGASGIFAWGSQLNLETAPSTYIRTTDTQVTAGLANTTAQVPLSNLVLRSEELDNALWLQSGTVTTSNQIASPDGALTADLVTTTAATSGHFVRPNSTMGSLLNTHLYRQSAYFKSGTVNRAQLFYQGASNLGINFNIDSCSLLHTVGAVLSTSFRKQDDGWCRVTFSFITTATSNFPSISFINVDNMALGASFSASGTENFYVWGVQVHPSGLSSDYVQTTTAAVTTSPLCPAGTTQSYVNPTRCFAVTPILDAMWTGSSSHVRPY